ncbi:hypothetical protein ACFQZ4_36420 [Catellatospora coxensis]
MWFLAVLSVGTALAIVRDPGLWVVLLDHGSTIAFVLICLSGVLLAAAGPVFGVRSVRARGSATRRPPSSRCAPPAPGTSAGSSTR